MIFTPLRIRNSAPTTKYSTNIMSSFLLADFEPQSRHRFDSHALARLDGLAARRVPELAVYPHLPAVMDGGDGRSDLVDQALCAGHGAAAAIAHEQHGHGEQRETEDRHGRDDER